MIDQDKFKLWFLVFIHKIILVNQIKKIYKFNFRNFHNSIGSKYLIELRDATFNELLIGIWSQYIVIYRSLKQILRLKLWCEKILMLNCFI